MRSPAARCAGRAGRGVEGGSRPGSISRLHLREGVRGEGRGIGIHSLCKTAINDAIRNGATMHEVREFAGHADIRTTEVYFVRKEEDAEVAARRIQIRVSGRKAE